MNRGCRDYLRRVGRAMNCPRRERKRLLAGFVPELEEAFPTDTAPTAADLTARFGAPAALAAELQDALPQGAAENYQRQRRKRWMAATAACVVIIALLVGYLAWLASIDVDVSKTETEIIIYK